MLTSLVEVLAVLVAVFVRIWLTSKPYEQWQWAIGVYILVSYIAHLDAVCCRQWRSMSSQEFWKRFWKELLRTWGLWPRNWRRGWGTIVCAFALNLLVLLFAGYRYSFQHFPWHVFWLKLPWYLFWGPLQQWVLCWFVQRLAVVFRTPIAMAIASGVVFAIVHLPNWPLVVICLANGAVSAYVLRRYNNLPAVGLCHSILGALTLVTVPESWLRHMIVGPNYWKWHP